jgi:hypothetical protein
MAALQDTDHSSADQQTTVATWTAQSSGLRRLPLRIAFSVADSSRLLWWLAFVIIPAALLAFAVTAGDKAWYVYSVYCGFLLMLISGRSERFINMTAELDQVAGEVEVIYHMGCPTLFRSDKHGSASFEDVESARSLSLGDQTMVRLHYKTSYTGKPTAFLVPPDIEPRFREALRHHSVSIRGDSEGKTTAIAWGRFVVTVLSLGVLPVTALFLKPVYSWPVLLALVVNSVFLTRQGW